MQAKFSVLVLLTTVTASTARAHHDIKNKANYKFGYGVYDPHTHDDKHHVEMRQGNHVIGEYSVKEPDGSYRTVKYKAGPHSGFEAVVEEIGKPLFWWQKRKTVNDIGVFRWDGKEGRDPKV